MTNEKEQALAGIFVIIALVSRKSLATSSAVTCLGRETKQDLEQGKKQEKQNMLNDTKNGQIKLVTSCTNEQRDRV